MITSTHLRAGSAIAIAVILASAASPAGAFNQPGTTRSAPISMLNSGNCPLERVGTQFVRCDYLTGDGVPAPAWVPERSGQADVTSQPLHGTTP
jgi:hypothetical protein